PGVEARGGAAHTLRSREHHALRDHLPGGVQGPSRRRGGALRPRLAGHHGGGGGRSGKALRPHPQLRRHALRDPPDHRLRGDRSMKALATVMSLVCLALTVPAGEGIAAESGREAPRVQPSAVRTAEAEYSRGIAAKRATNWGAAAVAFQHAVDLKPNYPEAWNELGFALRNQGKYPDSLKAYDQALRLRPDFPEA